MNTDDAASWGERPEDIEGDLSQDELWLRELLASDPAADLAGVQERVRVAVDEEWLRRVEPVPPAGADLDRLKQRVRTEVLRLTAMGKVRSAKRRNWVRWLSGLAAAAAVVFAVGLLWPMTPSVSPVPPMAHADLEDWVAAAEEPKVLNPLDRRLDVVAEELDALETELQESTALVSMQNELDDIGDRLTVLLQEMG